MLQLNTQDQLIITFYRDVCSWSDHMLFGYFVRSHRSSKLLNPISHSRRVIYSETNSNFRNVIR